MKTMNGEVRKLNEKELEGYRNATQPTREQQIEQTGKQYWRDYEGCVIREGDHYEDEKGQLLYWHSYESEEAQAFLSIASDEAERAARG